MDYLQRVSLCSYFPQVLSKSELESKTLFPRVQKTDTPAVTLLLFQGTVEMKNASLCYILPASALLDTESNILHSQ